MQLHGTWPEAIDAARRACERLAGGPDQPSTGAAFYQLGELHRLRGELASAEESYRQASRLGRKPQPGLALLRLAQGDASAAAVAIRVALDEAAERRTRARLLPAFVEITLANGDVAAVRAATGELATMAAELDAPFVVALAAQCEGAVLLAEGNHGEALAALRRAWAIWQELDAPYEGARVRVLTALALRGMSDHDGAAMELDAARWIFERLGATADVERVRLLARRTPPRTHGLSPRELEVLELVATGKTNRAIARTLAIAEKTVARHVANIFTKLGVSTRAAATAYAYEHDLARPDAQNYPSAPTRRDG
jgi:DNA-binding NarL/FixJ family response regulator